MKQTIKSAAIIALLALAFLCAGCRPTASTPSGEGSYATTSQQTAATSTPAAAPINAPAVYITRTGKRFHREGCGSLSRSSIPTTLTAARESGYTPCQRCSPLE